jgi:hypothetical protein
MKLKNKIYTLLSVFTLVGLTHSLTLKELNASLTAPSSFDIAYSYYAEYGDYYLYSPSEDILGQPLYTRTADSTYYNYSWNSNTGQYFTAPTGLPAGLGITMTFNRSNTSWSNFGGDYSGYYYPNTTGPIGSDNTVGTPGFKVNIVFDNQTNKDYRLYLDISSSAYGSPWELNYTVSSSVTNSYLINTTVLQNLFIPAYSKIDIINISVSSSRYLDAWYLKDLGVSNSYNNGYDVGQVDGYSDGLNNNPNILLNGFQAMVGILINFMLMILNLEVFNVSIMSVFGILALFVGVIWILKIVRG